MEDWLSASLFERRVDRLCLTEVGEHYAAAAGLSLDVLNEVTKRWLTRMSAVRSRPRPLRQDGRYRDCRNFARTTSESRFGLRRLYILHTQTVGFYLSP